MTKKPAIPQPINNHTDADWNDTKSEVQRIRESAIANATGLQESIQTKTEALRSRTNALKEVRLARKLTQKQLAATGLLTQPHISKIENGDPAAIALATLARFVEASGGKLEVNAVYGTDTIPIKFDTDQSVEKADIA